MKKSFLNELGNSIEISITEKDIEGIEGVVISIEGPNSQIENHVTKLEAEKLLEVLSEFSS